MPLKPKDNFIFTLLVSAAMVVVVIGVLVLARPAAPHIRTEQVQSDLNRAKTLLDSGTNFSRFRRR